MIVAQRDESACPVDLVIDRGGGVSGLPATVACRDGRTDSSYLDFSDLTFKTSGWVTQKAPLAEISAGRYRLVGGLNIAGITNLPDATSHLVLKLEATGETQSTIVALSDGFYDPAESVWLRDIAGHLYPAAGRALGRLRAELTFRKEIEYSSRQIIAYKEDAVTVAQRWDVKPFDLGTPVPTIGSPTKINPRSLTPILASYSWRQFLDPSFRIDVDGRIDRLIDRSGNGLHSVAASSALRPVAGHWNGFEVVTFDGSRYLRTAQQFTQSTVDAFVVGSAGLSPSGFMFCHGRGVAPQTDVFPSSTSFFLARTGVTGYSPGSGNDGAFHLWHLRWDGTTFEAWLDGANLATLTPAVSGTSANEQMALGAARDGSGLLTGSVASFLLSDGLSATDAANVRGLLLDLYDL